MENKTDNPTRVDVETWEPAAQICEFENTDRKLVELGGQQIGLFYVDGVFYATSAWCTHQRAMIMDGDIDDGCIMCPLHGAEFDLKTGEALSLPATRPVAVYDVRVEDGTVYINTAAK